MRRRDFIKVIAGSAGAWPLATRAQQQPNYVRRVGVLMMAAENDGEFSTYTRTLREELEKLGWIEGRNLKVDYRWGVVDSDLMTRATKELVAMQPDVILSQNTPTTASLLRQTQSIPIVFTGVSDPIGSRFVQALARPGGNVTGFVNMEGSLGGKWLGLLKEIVPRLTRVGFLFNPDTAPEGGSYFFGPFKAAAPHLGVEASAAPVRSTPELESVIADYGRDPNGGLMIMPDGFLNSHRTEITSLASHYRVPAIYPYRFYTEIGGLLSYGNDLLDNYRRAASYIDRILKGEKPSELPIQVPVKFNLVVNMKTARMLGIGIPESFLLRADEVIE